MLGVIHLDEALKEERLDFFVCFSAIASIFGNIGQADYAYANTFWMYSAGSVRKQQESIKDMVRAYQSTGHIGNMAGCQLMSK